MFVMCSAFLVAFSATPIQIALTRPLSNRSVSEIKAALVSMIHTLGVRGADVIEIEYDPESSFRQAVAELRGINCYPCAVKGHVVTAERLIQQLKEICRSVIHGLPW